LEGDRAAELLASPKTASNDGVLALNTAFVQGGVIINVREGADVSKPVELVHVGTGSGAIVTRSQIRVGKGAQLRVLESFAGDTGNGEINAVFDYHVADTAKVAATRLIAGESDPARLFTTIATLGAEAGFKSLG
ncbi:Fe-S cluster assembly protein SufD, partial [Roseibium sp. RKSG952]|nr:Fe-S cluster assembly protein SufD [Roseibium sp. RKSG952]